MGKRPAVTCRCGKNITGNTFKIHLRNSKCSCSLEDRELMLAVLDLKTKHHRAWLKSSGPEATADTNWYLSVISKTTKKEDWSFFSPRKQGLCTPTTIARMKIARRGQGNPSVRSKVFHFTAQEVLASIGALAQDFVKSDAMTFKDLKPVVDAFFPDFMYLLVQSGNEKTFKTLVVEASGLTDSEFKKLLYFKRGLKISKGQLASEFFRLKAAESASRLWSKWRISFPQRVLYAMVLTLDLDARLEYPFCRKSFDIYSPKINAFIEMHGDFWHKLGPKTGVLKSLIENNIENDKKKQQLAISNDFGYIAFWQSEAANWSIKLENIYGTAPTISLQQAENQVNQELGTARSVRH